MAGRLGRLVGLAALVVVLLRLGRVLEVAVDTPDWRLIAPAATVGGILLTWVGARLSPWRRASIQAVGVLLVVLRVTVPDTLVLGIFPAPASFAGLAEQLGYAVEILQFGAPPVLAVEGLTALTAVVLWALGGLWAWSAGGGPAWAGILPTLGFYLYLSVVDRAPSSAGWVLTSSVLFALGLVVTGNVVPSGAGRLRAGDHRPLPRWQGSQAMSVAAAVTLAGLVGAAALGSVVPDGGAVRWRNPGGEGSGFGGGGFSASRFAGLRQSIISLGNEAVFVATVEPRPQGGTTGYWRLLTLDRYDGEQWRVGNPGFAPLDEATPAENAPLTTSTTQTIQIRSLRDDRLPSLLTPVAVASDDSVIRSGTRLGQDGSLQLSARTFDGLTYRVESEVPQLDLGALASEGGELTPMFAEASAEGSFDQTPAATPSLPQPGGVDGFLALPDSIDPAIAGIARQATRGASTDFETALLLEDFLHGFDYSTDVSTGHSALDLVAWLSDPESTNYRTGYCEQFAAAMAVMGRVLGIPTRVVIGFTAGEQTETDNGPLTVVRERNAHAWVEMWIDGHGWVGFDPTPRGDGATTPMSAAVGFDPGDVDLPVAAGDVGVDALEQPDFVDFGPNIPVGDMLGDTSGPASSRGWRWLAAVAAIAALVGTVPALKSLRSRRRRRLAADGDIRAAWAEIVDRLEDLDRGPERHATPIEFARATEPALVPLARAYSAAIYGDRRDIGAAGHLRDAEKWIHERFDRSVRARASLRLRSLTTEGNWRRRRSG